MRTIVLAARKGGSGKTTLCRHLAVEADRRGDGPVALLDCDPQGGLSGWWNRRAAEEPSFIPSMTDDLEENLRKLEQGGIRLAFVDTPPAIGGIIEKVVRLATLVLIPARPSPDDLDAIGASIDAVEAAGKPMVFVVSGATKRARLTGQAAVVLSQHGTVAPATIHHSVAFPGSAISGQTVGEIEPGGSPAQEIAELWSYVKARLDKLAGKPERKQVSKKAGYQV